MTSPSRLTSCSHAQPAAPALGLSARAGLVPPVMRFSAAGRPSSRCPAGRHSTKRNKTCCRSILWVCPLARQKDLIISRLEYLARQGRSEDLSPSHKMRIDTFTPRPAFEQVLRPARLILHPDDPGLSASPPLGRGSARARAISCHNPIQVTQPLGLCRSL